MFTNSDPTDASRKNQALATVSGMDALPSPEQVADDVWAIASPIPDRGPPFTLTYALVGASGVHLIDPGWDSVVNRASLSAGLGRIGLRLEDVRTTIATHHHPDHLGLAPHLRDAVGATIVMGRHERAVLAHHSDPSRSDRNAYRATLERWGVPTARQAELVAEVIERPSDVVDVEPDRLLDDGESLELDGHRLTVLVTPGHTDGHLCLVDRDRGLLYTGDHVLPRINPGIGLGMLGDREPLEDHLRSLQALEPFDGYIVLPGHDEPFGDLRGRRTELMRHHLRRAREVAGLTGILGDAPVWDYAARMHWTAGWDGLHGFFLHAALAQTEHHLGFVRSGRVDLYDANVGLEAG